MTSDRFSLPVATGFLIILAIGVFLRVWNLGAQSLWLDEAHSVVQAQREWAEIWIRDARKDPNPPLYFTILKYWMLAFGTTEAAVRSFSAVCGTIAILGIFLFARSAGGATLGLAAAALAATSPWLVIYSRDARGYALATAAATLSLFGALKLITHFRPRGTARPKGPASGLSLSVAWAAYIGGAVMAMYTHATLVLLPVLVNLAFAVLWMTSGDRSWRVAVLWLTGNAAVAAAWLPWVPHVVGGEVVAGTFWVPPVSPRQAFAIVREVYGHAYLRTLQPWLDLVLLVIAMVAILRLRRSQAALLLCLGAVVLVPFLTWLVSLARPIFLERVLIWPLPFLCVLLAAGLLMARARWMAGALILVLVLIQLDSLRHHGWRSQGWTRFHEPWRDLVARLQDERQDGDAVVVVPSYAAMPFEYYAGPDADTSAVAVKLPGGPRPHWSYATVGSDDLPEKTASRSGRFWLVVRRQPSDVGINAVVERFLREGHPTLRFRDQALELYRVEQRR